MEKNGFAVIATKEEVRLLYHLQILKQPQLLLFTFGACLCSLQHMKLKEIMDNKNYTEIFEDEKELLWKLRSVVRDHYPESLSKLLLITKWNKREDVVQMVGLLRHWPDLPAIHALELLDYSFPDPSVRAFTVRCLRKLRCARITPVSSHHRFGFLRLLTLFVCSQWWRASAVSDPAGPGVEVRVLSGLRPHHLPAGEGSVQQQDRTLSILASQVSLGL